MEVYQIFPIPELKPNKIKMQKLLKHFFLISLLNITALTSMASAQEIGTIFGKVVDSATGEDLIGANIFLEGTYNRSCN